MHAIAGLSHPSRFYEPDKTNRNYQTPAQIIRRLPKLSDACPNYQTPAQIIRRLPKLSDACPNGGSRAVAPPPPRPPKPEFKKTLILQT
jgi:rRNA maturation protein Nop10